MSLHQINCIFKQCRQYNRKATGQRPVRHVNVNNPADVRSIIMGYLTAKICFEIARFPTSSRQMARPTNYLRSKDGLGNKLKLVFSIIKSPVPAKCSGSGGKKSIKHRETWTRHNRHL